MASITRALGRIKQDLEQYLPESSIIEACEQAGHQWRERKLGPAATVHLFVLQVLAFNTAMTHLRHPAGDLAGDLAGCAVKAAAYCKARKRLPLAALQQLLRNSAEAMASAMRQALASAMRQALAAAAPQDAPEDDAGGVGLWRGLRAYLVDGSSTITPDTPALQKGQKKGCGFPVPKLLALFDAFSGLVVEMLAFPLYTHEQSKVWRLHPLLKARDLLVADCGFCSFVHLAMLAGRGVFACFRMHQRQIVDFRPHRKDRKDRSRCAKGRRKGRPAGVFVRRLGKHDQVVRWRKPEARPKWISDEQWASLPESLEVREVRYHIPRRGQRTLCVTIAATLLDPVLYPREKIAELYHVRWRVETHFAELKATLKMRELKSKTEEGVRKELAVYCLVYNLVHALMMKAASRQGVTPDRIRSLDAVRWMLCAAPGEDLPDLIVNPHRPGRHEPRVIKDLQDTYRNMTRPRSDLQKSLKNQAIAA